MYLLIDSKKSIAGVAVTRFNMFSYCSAVKGNQSLASPQGQDWCVESHCPDQIPSGPWETGRYWFPLRSTFSFPSSILLTLTLFHSGLLEIPLPPAIIERHPSLALSSHFCETCNSAQDKYKMHLNLSGTSKTTGGQLGGRKHSDRKNVSSLTARDTSAWVYRQYFSAWAVKLNRTVFCYLDKVDTA